MLHKHALAGTLLLLVACSGETDFADIDGTVPDQQTVEVGSPDIPVVFEIIEDSGGPELRFDQYADGLGDLPPDDGWGPAPGEAGWPCDDGEDCLSTYCILTPDGRRCTQTCEQECPFGWQCVEYQPALPDQVFLCLPGMMDLCKPCSANTDCTTNGGDTGAKCVQYGAAGNYCGAPCGNGEGCPDGYACMESQDVSGAAVSQCRRTAGDCTCAQWFVDQGAATTCYVENEFGTCTGERSCKALGLTDCTAAVPGAEVCNGADDDCDGEADEGTSGGECLVVNSYGACPGIEECLAGKLSCAGDEPQMELCDGADNDCDGKVDEDFADTDGDGKADCLETDKDGDGIADGMDNCPAQFNPDQKDFDVDTIGDVCDPDDDNDLSPDDLDCMPHDAAAHPGGAEVCDGKDNDCNALVDEGFVDTDADGWKDCVDTDDDNDGSPDAQDCKPLDENTFPGAEEICDGLDNNCDFVVDEGFDDLDEDGTADCAEGDIDGDGVPDTLDCKPYDPAIHPGALEVCDGIDNDCDLAEDEGFPDTDLDGIKNCMDDDDDNDGDPDATDCQPFVPAVHSAAPEACDAIDNNCDGQVDEGFGTLACGKGLCAQEIAACAGGKLQYCDPYAGAAEETCDGLDNDCDGLTDEDQGTTTCGLGHCTHTVANCADGAVQPCDPLEGAADEVCDGIDNDCDGKTDEGMAPLTCGKGACFHTVSACVGGVEQECNPFAGAQPESCDGIDNDCDGQADEGLGTVLCGVGECSHAMDYCVEGKIAVCNPFLGASVETCDGMDNDCDGLTDENLLPLTCGKGICEHTVVACLDGVPQECDPLAGALPEQCDGFDNDCDGLIDEGLGYTTCGLGACAHTVANCTDGQQVACDPMEGASEEVCDSVDNNCDGIVDPEGAGDCITFFRDDDDDGYGQTADSQCLCEPAAPYTAVLDGDCDDTGAEVNPLQEEDCYTAADEDCSGAANEGCVYASCAEVLQYNEGAESGAFTIDPDGAAGDDPFPVWCDLETDGGGWTLVMKQASDMGYGSPLAVGNWSGWSQPDVTMSPEDATLDDANMVNLAYSTLSGQTLRLTASQTWTDLASGGWERTVNSTAYSALSNANANQTGNLGGTDTTPWAPASFTDHTWTTSSTDQALCWRAGPFFNRTSFEYTDGGIKWGWFFNNECHQSTTDTAEGLGCCGNSGWYRKSPWALYLWIR